MPLFYIKVDDLLEVVKPVLENLDPRYLNKLGFISRRKNDDDHVEP